MTNKVNKSFIYFSRTLFGIPPISTQVQSQGQGQNLTVFAAACCLNKYG